MMRSLINLFRRWREPILEPRLYGTWHSDAAATLDRLRDDPRCPENPTADHFQLVRHSTKSAPNRCEQWVETPPHSQRATDNNDIGPG
jgi:hypothetical protein